MRKETLLGCDLQFSVDYIAAFIHKKIKIHDITLIHLFICIAIIYIQSVSKLITGEHNYNAIPLLESIKVIRLDFSSLEHFKSLSYGIYVAK